RALERDPRLLLGLEQPDPVEREPGERTERSEQGKLLVAEERRIRGGPDDEASTRHFEVDELGVLPERRRGLAALEVLPRVGRHVPRSDDATLCVADRDRARPDDRGRRLEHARRDLLLRRREGEQARNRLLK